ncbi:MAG TPA: aminotransferase class I/II-fold pyridoxal phosphate-dependent enzyme, partial [Terrimesophilobacter sp.]|nr:aminotransferase class I/II-fold pyridoxal phosphate-dependent enzyme [Terrimesophilobacter sp.]
MATLDDLPLRDDLRGPTPYGAPQLDVPVRLNVNENAHPIPESTARDIVKTLAWAVLTANRYPDREFTGLRQALADYLGHGITADQIWAANGSNEVLQHALQAFGGPGRTALGFTPTYSMHPIISVGTGTGWISGLRDPDYGLSPTTVTQQITQHEPDITFLCSPNNPTGTPVDLDTVEAAYDATDGIL